MSKLIYADIPRVLRSKITLGSILITIFMAAASVLTAVLDAESKGLVFRISTNNLTLFIAMLMPIFSGGVSILIISTEFSSGIIRNKLIMGHSRRSILFAWTVIYSLLTLVTYIISVSAFFITLKLNGCTIPEGNTGTIITNLILIFCFVLKFQAFSLLMLCIYPDAKLAVICYMLNNMTMLLLVFASFSQNSKKIVKALSRIFIYAYTSSDDFSFLTKPDTPWLTALCTLSLSAVYMFLAARYFAKKDLK